MRKAEVRMQKYGGCSSRTIRRGSKHRLVHRRGCIRWYVERGSLLVSRLVLAILQRRQSCSPWSGQRDGSGLFCLGLRTKSLLVYRRTVRYAVWPTSRLIRANRDFAIPLRYPATGQASLLPEYLCAANI